MQTQHNPPDPQTGHLATRQVAALLRVSPDTVRRNAPRLGGAKVLGRYRYDPSAVTAVASGGAA